ncbi:MAG: hypothetical protein ACXWLC_06255 [Rhizomicrobium sp.]|jgi:hypothetical protein
MKFGKLILAAAVAGLTMVASFAPTMAKEGTAAPDGAARANLAATLAQYGIANKDPASLLAAAHIINGLKANVAKQSPAAGGAKPESYDALTLLKLAKSYATGPNASLESAIEGEMKNVSATQAVCYYQYYCNYGYCWYQYYCY